MLDLLTRSSLLYVLGRSVDGERDRNAEQRSGYDVGEPVHLEVGAAPGHPKHSQGGEYPTEAAARAGRGEEEDERDAGRAGVCGVTGRE
jgi:hypothetical protein